MLGPRRQPLGRRGMDRPPGRLSVIHGVWQLRPFGRPVVLGSGDRAPNMAHGSIHVFHGNTAQVFRKAALLGFIPVLLRLRFSDSPRTVRYVRTQAHLRNLEPGQKQMSGLSRQGP